MILRVATCTLLLAVSCCPALSAQMQCDTRTIRGTWAYNYQGSIILPDVPQPVPIVMPGVASIDAQGRMTAPGTAIMGGQVLDFEMVNVTLEVKPDCTATAKWGLKAKGAPAAFPRPGYRPVRDYSPEQRVPVHDDPGRPRKTHLHRHLEADPRGSDSGGMVRKASDAAF